MTEGPVAGEVSASAAPAERSAPVAAAERIEALDVLRGFALLGILLLNILGFGMHTAGYFNPLMGAGDHLAVNLAVWAGVNVLFEGAMRALFSMLFGAGVVMFTTGLGSTSGTGKSGVLHYRRNLWLLLFGLLDAYVLLWSGDILIVYAVAGALLYPLRNLAPRTLLIIAGVLLLLTSAVYLAAGAGMSMARAAAMEVDAAPTAEHPEDVRAMAEVWRDFAADYDPASQTEELEIRRSDYLTVARWNAGVVAEQLLFVMPMFLLWDALIMMLLGMALYRLRVLSGERSAGFYARLMAGGFALGLIGNGYELARAVQTDYDILAVFGYMQGTYHVGRLGMALGWLGLVMLMCRRSSMAKFRRRLAAVGRAALSNYLLHSLICLFLFTGVGLGLVGDLERWALYPIVFAIWALQLLVSPWWLDRCAFGPAEWLLAVLDLRRETAFLGCSLSLSRRTRS